jgi:rubredoxin
MYATPPTSEAVYGTARSPGQEGQAAAAERLSQFRCVSCGYGASCKIAPERCPMCGGGSWEYQERGRPESVTSSSTPRLNQHGRL